MKKRTTAKELYARFDQIDASVQNILLGYALDYGKIEFPQEYQFPLEQNTWLNVSGLELVDDVHGFIMWDRPNVNNELGRDIMSSAFTFRDRMKTLEIVEVVIAQKKLKPISN